MPSDYKFFHGALLQELIVSSERELRIAAKKLAGRADAYVINADIGLILKHSSARMSPWQFTFLKEHRDEIAELQRLTRECFVGLICGRDGFVCLRASDVTELLHSSEKEISSLRIERRPRKMYRVSSSGYALDRKVAQGVDQIVEEIKRQSTECAPPSSLIAKRSSLSEPADIV